MAIFRAIVIVEVEADDEEQASHAVQDEVSQSAFEGILSITEVVE